MALAVSVLCLLVGALCVHLGLAVSILPPPCTDIACRCEYGTEWTVKGQCSECSCKPKPFECPLYKCLELPCSIDQRQTDENGCRICKCKPQLPCPAIGLLFCRYGYTVDKNGCKICRNIPCRKRVCPAIACLNDFKKDASGCPTCQCNNPICPQVMCPAPETCESEIFKDSNGCTKCRCKKVCKDINCPLIKCAYGYVTNSEGCPICQCKNVPCPQVRCANQCPNGFLYNSNGCQTCTCKRQQPTCLKCLNPY